VKKVSQVATAAVAFVTLSCLGMAWAGSEMEKPPTRIDPADEASPTVGRFILPSELPTIPTVNTTPEPTAKATKVPAERTQTPTRKPVPATKKPTPKPTVTKPPAEETYYANCPALRKDHPSGVPKGHPAYRSGLDRDKDGWACEK